MNILISSYSLVYRYYYVIRFDASWDCFKVLTQLETDIFMRYEESAIKKDIFNIGG